MNIKLLKSSIIVWFLLVIAAIINGIFRVSIMEKQFSAEVSHILSTLILLTLIGFITFFYLKKTTYQYSKKELMITGVIWFGLTILFEFIFGHFVAGHSWEKLLSDYNLFNGRIWILILISNLFFPYLIGKKILNKS